MRNTLVLFAVLVATLFALVGCGTYEGTADDKARTTQETLLKEALAQSGMPNIKNFFEMKTLKTILELRDQADYVTYTYLYNEYNGKLIFLGKSIGYGIPYATQYTNPQKPVDVGYHDSPVIAQADPNGLFSPSSAEGTWVLLQGSDGSVKPVYIEPRIVVSPFPLPDNLLQKQTLPSA